MSAGSRVADYAAQLQAVHPEYAEELDAFTRLMLGVDDQTSEYPGIKQHVAYVAWSLSEEIGPANLQDGDIALLIIRGVARFLQLHGQVEHDITIGRHTQAVAMLVGYVSRQVRYEITTEVLADRGETAITLTRSILRAMDGEHALYAQTGQIAQSIPYVAEDVLPLHIVVANGVDDFSPQN